MTFIQSKQCSSSALPSHSSPQATKDCLSSPKQQQSHKGGRPYAAGLKRCHALIRRHSWVQYSLFLYTWPWGLASCRWVRCGHLSLLLQSHVANQGYIEWDTATREKGLNCVAQVPLGVHVCSRCMLMPFVQEVCHLGLDAGVSPLVRSLGWSLIELLPSKPGALCRGSHAPVDKGGHSQRKCRHAGELTGVAR